MCLSLHGRYVIISAAADTSAITQIVLLHRYLQPPIIARFSFASVRSVEHYGLHLKIALS